MKYCTENIFIKASDVMHRNDITSETYVTNSGIDLNLLPPTYGVNPKSLFKVVLMDFGLRQLR